MSRAKAGWTRLGRLALALALLSFSSGVAFCVHGVASGTIIPHQDPTPERREYERFHDDAISKPLFLCSGASGLASVVVGAAWAALGAVRGL